MAAVWQGPGGGLTRRAFAGAACCWLGVRPIAAQEQSTVFRATRVDVAPLVARGGVAAAQQIAHVLPGQLATTFADHIDPRAQAPVLVARIDTIYLSDFGEAPGAYEAGLHTDTLSGAGLVVGAGGVLSTVPLTVHLPPGYSGAYYLPDIDVRRITSLCESFASWLRREMNL